MLKENPVVLEEVERANVNLIFAISHHIENRFKITPLKFFLTGLTTFVHLILDLILEPIWEKQKKRWIPNDTNGNKQ